MKALVIPSVAFGLLTGHLMALGQATAQGGKVRVVGYLEDAVIVAAKLPMKAKMDTGARTTSIHAINIERFRKGGHNWVRFTVAVRNRQVTFERKIFRISRIRRTRVGVVERVVVKLGICLAGYYKMAQVNLTDRSNMNYPLLIGRRFMHSAGLAIASGRKFLSRPDCENVPKTN